MSRYIDADALYKHIVNKMGGVDCSVLLDESIAPSIDIVRCKECKHRGICFGRLVQGTKVVQLNFCSCGEREGE